MKPLYSVTLTSGFYSNDSSPAAIDGSYTDVRQAIKAVSQAAERYFGPVGGEWGSGTIISDTGVKLTLDHEMRHPVWIVSRQIEVEWTREVTATEKQTVIVDGAEYSRDVEVVKPWMQRRLQMFAARIRLGGYLITDLTDATKTDDAMTELAEAAADAAWDNIKQET